MSDPFASPVSPTRTQALSSKPTQVPSGRRYCFFCRMTTARSIWWRISGVPFFTATVMRSPIPAAGVRLAVPWYFSTAMISTILAPVLSAQVRRAPLGSERMTLAGIPFMASTSLIVPLRGLRGRLERRLALRPVALALGLHRAHRELLRDLLGLGRGQLELALGHRALDDRDHDEGDRLGDRAALRDSHAVPLVDIEAGGRVHRVLARHAAQALELLVLALELAAHRDRLRHRRRDDFAVED